jgi:hypothetical protein
MAYGNRPQRSPNDILRISDGEKVGHLWGPNFIGTVVGIEMPLVKVKGDNGVIQFMDRDELTTPERPPPRPRFDERTERKKRRDRDDDEDMRD